jgi:hypothetical protein
MNDRMRSHSSTPAHSSWAAVEERKSTYGLDLPAASVIAYWGFTLVVVYENLSGFVWWITNFEYISRLVRHLGYPEYVLNILGPAQLAAALILIAPGLPIVKEWAYAGALINYVSAIASHLFAGDGLNVFVVAALLYSVFTVGSWALRPASRRVTRTPWIGDTRASSWLIATMILVLMLIVALLSLPLIESLSTRVPL